MADDKNIYLKQKAVPKTDSALDKEVEFLKKRQKLMAETPRITSDLGQSVSKDLGVEKIDKNQFKDIVSTDSAMNKVAEHRAAKELARTNADPNTIDYRSFKKPANPNLAEKVYDAGEMKRQYQEMAKASRGAGKLMGAIPALGALTQVVPSAVDLKEGNPNTAMARMITGLAPAGTGELDAKLMQQAQLQDNSPELQDPTYLNTLKAIGQRRQASGKSPVVETISGQKVDTSATEDNDFLNKVMALQRSKSNG